MDVVYLVKNDPENNSEELRYSLRSLKNLDHGRVVIVGEKPDWATNVVYIPVSQDKSKSENVKNNLIAAVNSELVSDDFLLMNDDFFIMKKAAGVPALSLGLMSDVIAQYLERYPEGSDYIDSMKKLYDVLTANGVEKPLSYELHLPMPLNKHKVIDLHKKATGPLYQFRSYYGNYFNIGGDTVADVKVFRDNRHNSPEYVASPMDYLEDQAFLSATGGSFKKDLPGDFVRSKFTDKSIYEI